MSTEETLSAAEYEELTKSLVDLVSDRSPVHTTSLERNVVLQGKATTNQIDVVWEFEAGDRVHRILLECRNYKRKLTQGAVHAFRSVVDDLNDEQVPCIGVMVTRTGYQPGAKAVAETYGVIILELRHPDDADLRNRVTTVQITMVPRIPVFDQVHIQVEDDYEGEQGPFNVLNADTQIQEEGKEPRSLLELIMEGEINAIDQEPTPIHPVRRTFDPPARLVIEGIATGRIREISALVGEKEADPYDLTVGGLTNLSWMVKETLGGARAWFTQEGKMYVTPE